MITNEKNALMLDHVNIVKTIDVIVRNEQHSIIVMEYLPDSQVLQSIIDNEKIQLKFSDIVKCTLDITAGLKYIHAQNLLHLDLKPGNVLVTKGICKICDFGSSRFNFNPNDVQSNHIFEGNTVQYTAPEILIGKEANQSSDTYSLGILMWQLRYRENPFKSLENRDTIIYNVVKYGLRPRAESRDEIQDDFSQLYQSCWSLEPTLRPTLESVETQLGKRCHQ
ncbi:proto-oncogene serine/threonine-protein kinase mos [Atheta coriaria]|uniref:proto-oncogene serine/threonine-protein kinase mos n=1 Tax=Dalotia coriaria TaxID=877792 RepID=UPI0031F4391B